MNGAHWHLVLNHIPIFLTLIGTVFLIAGLYRKRGTELKVASLVLLVLAGAVIVPVYYTGHQAEEIVEHRTGVNESLLEQHEELAEITRFIIIGLGLISFVALAWVAKGSPPNWFYGAVVMLALIGCGYLGYTAYLGGQARHPEIRSDFRFRGDADDAYEAEPPRETEDEGEGRGVMD